MIMCNNKFIRYIFFALISSSINIVMYYITYTFIIESVVLSNIVSYTFSIIFQFITNKKLVYKNCSKKYIKEFLSFCMIKVLAFIIDTSVLYLLVDCVHMNNFLAKIISNCSTTISNYALNQKVVFKDEC